MAERTHSWSENSARRTRGYVRNAGWEKESGCINVLKRFELRTFASFFSVRQDEKNNKCAISLSSHSLPFLSMVRFWFPFTPRLVFSSLSLIPRRLLFFHHEKRFPAGAEKSNDSRQRSTRLSSIQFGLSYTERRTFSLFSLTWRLKKSPWDTHVYVDTRLVSPSSLQAGEKRSLMSHVIKRTRPALLSFCLCVYREGKKRLESPTWQETVLN